MIRIIKSIYFWAAGLFFFILCFPVFFLFLIFFSRKTTYKVSTFLFGILLKIMGMELIVMGRENIETNKPYIIMGNHQSLFDVFVIPRAIPEPFVGIEAAYHFNYPLWGWIIKKWGNIPIDRSDITKAIKSIKSAETILKKGVSIGILPEGHRTLTGKTGTFKKGGFHLAKNTKTDILPIGISKSLYDYKNKGSWTISPQKVTAVIGKPLTHDSYKNLSIDQLRGLVRDNIMGLIQ